MRGRGFATLRRGVNVKRSALHCALYLIARASCLAAGLLLTACGDFHGPWEYYPHTTEIYAGVYTYGYIMEGESPRICFSKMYELEESSAENFAFYDSAKVTVLDTTAKSAPVQLVPETGKPNCFVADSSSGLVGKAGDSYKMEAFFKWDSSGEKVSTTYKAVATIPKKFSVKKVKIPQQDGKTKDVALNGKGFETNFLTFPRDMDIFKFYTEHDKDLGGVLVTLTYDNVNGGESMNTTVHKMLSNFADKDSTGFVFSLSNSLENTKRLGYNDNWTIGGYNSADTIFVSNISFPIGESVLHFYATDSAYMDYEDYVLEALEDPRVVPVSNIENGMGVFSGMKRVDIPVKIKGDDYLEFEYIRSASCKQAGDDPDDKEGWKNRACRLYQDVYCSGMPYGDSTAGGTDLVTANSKAGAYFAEGDYLVNETCYPSLVKAAMMLDTTKWSVFLPDTIDAKDKSNAYADGLKRYCVAGNFESNKIADCSSLKKDCLESTEKNDCLEYFWEWCADRDWDYGRFPQCKSALVSRYYIEEQKSPVLAREVELICKQDKPAVCKNW